MKSKTRHADGGGSNPLVHEEIHRKMRFAKNRRFNKKNTNPNRSAKVKGNAYETKNTTC